MQAQGRLWQAGSICIVAVLLTVSFGAVSADYSHARSPFTHDQPTLAALLDSEVCRDIGHTYEWLITEQLAQWTQYEAKFNAAILEAAKNDLTALIFIKDNEMYVASKGTRLNGFMLHGFMQYIHSIKDKAPIPDLVMIINGEDLPQGREFPVFSFCRRPSTHNDLLLPNSLIDWIWWGSGDPGESRAGEHDPRMPKVVWYGRPHAWHRGSRKIVAAASAARPDKIHAGLIEWKGFPEWAKTGREEEWEEYQKIEVPQEEWANQYKYQMNVPGGCASSRLAFQLYTDAAVMILASEDEEWFTPLLRPYVHYIPVHAMPETDTRNASQHNIIEQIEWAENHPHHVRAIVDRSTEFAHHHLRPGSGRDCYSLLLLHAYSTLMDGEELIVPEGAEPFPPRPQEDPPEENPPEENPEAELNPEGI